MKTTIISLAAAAALSLGVASTASAAPASLAAPAAKTAIGSQIGGGNLELAGRRGFRRHFGLWKYDYRPRYVCKHRYRWVWTKFGWRQVHLGYRCSYTNNY